MSKFPSSTNYFEAIGRMAVYVAYVEELVESCYERVFRHNHSYKSKKPISDKVLDLKKKFQSDSSFVDLCDFTLSLIDDRNKILHGRIYGNRGNKLPEITHPRSKTFNQKISINEIDGVQCNAYHAYLGWFLYK